MLTGLIPTPSFHFVDVSEGEGSAAPEYTQCDWETGVPTTSHQLHQSPDAIEDPIRISGVPGWPKARGPAPLWVYTIHSSLLPGKKNILASQGRKENTDGPQLALPQLVSCCVFPSLHTMRH